MDDGRDCEAVQLIASKAHYIGLGVMGGDSCPEGCGLESQYRILGKWAFSH